MRALTHLECIHMNNNSLTHVPHTLAELSALKQIDFEGNKLEDPPQAVIPHKRERQLQAFKKFAKEKEEEREKERKEREEEFGDL